MPRCPRGTRRCPPSVGKCHKTGKSGKTAKKQPKLKKSASTVTKSAPKVNKVSELIKIFEKPTEVDPTKEKRSWMEHLKWCSKHFDIKYGKAMTDARCRKIWEDTR
tara:strand:- start:469 stop:786 length:318 start_codon:yes stop_codon:yes gene_type:complete